MRHGVVEDRSRGVWELYWNGVYVGYQESSAKAHEEWDRYSWRNPPRIINEED